MFYGISLSAQTEIQQVQTNIQNSIKTDGQPDRIDSLLNELIYSDETIMSTIVQPVKSDFLYAGLNYNSKTYFAGREIGIDLVNVSGHVFYFSSLGVFAGVSGIWYDQLTPGYSTTMLTLGYGSYLDKKKNFRASGSYTRFIYTNPDSAAIYPYLNNANVTLAYRKNWFGARVSGNMLFGGETLFNFSPTVYSNFYFWKFGKNNKFYLGPEISCYFSKETINAETNPTECFGLLNTKLLVPFSVNLGNLEVQLGYSLNFPVTQDKNITYQISSAFSVSAFYLIPL